MNRLVSTTQSLLRLGAPLLGISLAFGVEPTKPDEPPHFAGQAPGEAQALMHRVAGTVAAVDAKQMSLTVKTEEGDQTVHLTDKTRITGSDKPAKFQDITVGKKVEIIVKHVNAEGDVVTEVNFRFP